VNLSSMAYLAFGALVTCGCWALALAGPPSTSRPEVMPMSVRDNPASFRPTYSLYSGWHPLPSPSSSGGGFGFGK
jgi:hypothetical protein